MDVNRSGYYKWKARQGTGNRYEKIRIELTALLMAEHINAANMQGYGPPQGADVTESRVRKVCGLKMW